MIKKISYTAALALALTGAQAQFNSAPPVNSVSKPWTRWWWMGSAVNEKDLTANMEAYAKAGIGGLEITPIYGVASYEKQFIDYLSPRWMQLFAHTLKEAKRLGLKIDIATGSGWPFGGGPLIGDQDACKDFEYKTWQIKGGETVKETIEFIQEPMIRQEGNHLEGYATKNAAASANGMPTAATFKDLAHVTDISKLSEPVYANKNLQALALDQVKFRKKLPLQVVMGYNDKGQTIDLTKNVDGAGKLVWTASEGNWTIYALFMGYHGKMVERAAPGAEGNAIDHFSKPALDKYLGRFDKAFTGADLSGLRGFFNDSYEVDDARGQSNYTPGFFDEFKKRRGYDLKLYLPQLLAKQPDELSTRVLFDYRQTIADLLLENFTIPWQGWAKTKGKIVRNQSHGSPGNTLDLYGAVDIPETEGTELLRFKFASSTAHILNKNLTSAEAATWLGEHFKSQLSDVKEAIDRYFVGGVNHIVYHGTAYSPVADPWPGWLFYASVHFQPTNPFWNDFAALNGYAARTQAILQSGKPDNDVLVYFPFSDHNSEPGKELLHHYDGMKGMEKTDFNDVSEEMLKKGYAFDFISDKQIQQLTNDGPMLKAPGGVYRTIVLPNNKYLPLATLQKLMELAKNGAHIVVYKNMPAGAPGLDLDKKTETQFNALVQGLKFEGNDIVATAQVGKGTFVKGKEIESLLMNRKVPRETMFDKGLQCIRRTGDNGGKYYFISNTSGKDFTGYVPLAAKGFNSVSIYDPMTQQKGMANQQRDADNNPSVYLQLKAGETCILQTTAAMVKGIPYPYYTPTDEQPFQINGTWRLRFINGGPVLPAPTTVTKLGSWTELPSSFAKSFSGTVIYANRFAKPVTTQAPAYLLDLGKVAQSAEVSLNGKVIATLFGPSYQVVIPAGLLKEKDNMLRIKVSNGMTNRIIDMEKKGEQWKKFYNIDFPARLPANKGADGVFTAANWQIEESGLLTTVTLVPLKISAP